MARNRTIDDGGVALPAIRPAASPLDVFIRPAQGGGLGQLAAALSGVAPELRRLGNEVNQRDADADVAQGEAWAVEQANSKELWSGAIRDGKIAAAHSPWFRLAAKKKLGQVAAERFNVGLQESIAKLGDAATPDAFEAAVTESRKAFLSSTVGKSADDIGFMQGFNATAEAQVTNARRVFAAEHAKQYELQASNAYFQSAHSMARQAIESGQSVGDIAKLLNGEADAWAGVNPAAKRSGTLSANSLESINASVIFSLMKSTGNTKLADDLAKQIKNGDGTLFDSAAYQSKAHETADHVTEDQIRKESAAHVEQERAQEDAREKATDALLTRWRKGGAVDTSDIEAQLKASGIDNPQAEALKIVNRLPELDPRYFVTFRSGIARGKMPSIASLDNAARSHQISDSQYNSLVGDIEQAQRAERSLALQGAATTESIWGHPAMKALEDNIRSAAKTKAKLGPLGEIVSYTGFTESDVQQSVFQGRMFLASWLSQNWNKYGAGNEAMQQAASAWRGFALQHGVISTDEAGMNDKVLPSDPMLRKQVEKNSSKPEGKKPGNFTKVEIRRMRDEVARAAGWSAEQRSTWARDPRNSAIIKQLGVTDPAQLPAALAEAEGKAR